MDLIKTVQEFLQERWDRKSPLLLGYSGGPDSKALLYCLLKSGVRPLHLAHIDHGWREESEMEASLLAKEASLWNLPFYSIRLSEKPVGNLEDFGRVQRLKFFRSLFEQIPFAALLLAHQADDCAETSLKRMFEGAHLTNLGGIKKCCSIEGMQVWRPLLRVRKKEIMAFIQSHGLEPLCDVTNEDVRFLRARLRKEVLPSLEKSFGKGIVSNLSLLSERSFEIKEYLDRKIEPLLKEAFEGASEISLQLSGVERVEARHALQAVLVKLKVSITRNVLERWLDALQEGRVGVRLEVGGVTLMADRGLAMVRKSLNKKDSLEFF